MAHQPIIINGFSGLYDRREEFTDLPPSNQAAPIPLNIADNVIFHDNYGIGTRPKFEARDSVAGTVTQISPIAVDNLQRYLYLRRGVGLFDSRDHTSSILTVTDTNVIGFRIKQLYGRVFITLIQWSSSQLVGYGNVYLYDPSTVADVRLAGGVAPEQRNSADIGVTQDVPTGYTSFTDCKYYFAVVYETDSGFVTPPGPKDGALISINSVRQNVSPNQIGCGLGRLSNIPMGPSGTVRRHILMTHQAEIYFTDFSDFGKIRWYYAPQDVQDEFDNNTITSYTFNTLIFDSELVDEATDLFYQYERIAAGVDISDFAERLVVVGNKDTASELDKHAVRLSDLGKPESFSTTSGRILVHQRDGHRVTRAFAIRNTLFVGKERGLYAYSDNGSDPGTWSPFTVDSAVGAVDISEPVPGERFCIADKNGIYAFDGVINPITLTYPIESLWQRISKSINFPRLQIALNHSERSIYVCYSDEDASNLNRYILYGKYTNPLGESPVRWAKWNMNLGSKRLACVALETLDDRAAAANNLIVGGNFSGIARLGDEVGHFDVGDERLYWRFELSYLNLDGNQKHIDNVRIEGDLDGRVHTALVQPGKAAVIETRLRQMFDGGTFDIKYNREVVKYSVRFLQGTRQVSGDADEDTNYFRGLVKRITRILVYAQTQWMDSPVVRAYEFDDKQNNTNLDSASQWYVNSNAQQVRLFGTGPHVQAMGVVTQGSKLRLNGVTYEVSGVSVSGDSLVISFTTAPNIVGGLLRLSLGVVR